MRSSRLLRLSLCALVTVVCLVLATSVRGQTPDQKTDSTGTKQTVKKMEFRTDQEKSDLRMGIDSRTVEPYVKMVGDTLVRSFLKEAGRFVDKQSATEAAKKDNENQKSQK